MVELDRRYPGYGFAQHKGYPVPEHRCALDKLGPCPIHRRSYQWVRQMLERPAQRELDLGAKRELLLPTSSTRKASRTKKGGQRAT
jgi:hypothetical protein